MSIRQGNLLGIPMRSKTLLHKTGLKYLLGVALFFAFTQNAGSKPAGSAPAFNAGSSQLIMVCKNSGGTGISTSMSITDADVGQTETWTVTLAPTHGTLSGFPVSLTSTGSSIAPGGVTYTPAPGYTGADVFAVQVSDGSLIASTTVNVNVSAGPALTSTLTPPAICNNTVFSYSPTSATGGAPRPQCCER